MAAMYMGAGAGYSRSFMGYDIVFGISARSDMPGFRRRRLSFHNEKGSREVLTCCMPWGLDCSVHASPRERRVAPTGAGRRVMLGPPGVR